MFAVMLMAMMSDGKSDCKCECGKPTQIANRYIYIPVPVRAGACLCWTQGEMCVCKDGDCKCGKICSCEHCPGNLRVTISRVVTTRVLVTRRVCRWRR